MKNIAPQMSIIASINKLYNASKNSRLKINAIKKTAQKELLNIKEYLQVDEIACIFFFSNNL